MFIYGKEKGMEYKMVPTNQKQRRFRNELERKAICMQAIESLAQNGITVHVSPEIEAFTKILDEFMANAGNGRTFSGQIELKELGATLDYFFSGRRVLPHFARISKTKKENEPQNVFKPRGSLHL